MIDLFYVRVYLLVCRSGWFRLGVQEGCLGFYCCFTIAPGGDLCVVSLFTSKHCVKQGRLCCVWSVLCGGGGRGAFGRYRLVLLSMVGWEGWATFLHPQTDLTGAIHK